MTVLPRTPATFWLFHTDALIALKELTDNSIDSLVTDPPAGIEFMGKEWDSFKGDSRQPGNEKFHENDYSRRAKVQHGASGGYKNIGVRDAFICSLTPIFKETLRVLKPGAHGLVWAIPRTSHWTATALEDAGFEIRDVVVHLQGQGFPKAANAGRQIDMELCELPGRHYDKTLPKGEKFRVNDHLCPPCEKGDAHRGEYTALKPGAENWILVRKPLIETVGKNVLEYGTGALEIDACRLVGADGDGHWSGDDGSDATSKPGYESGFTKGGTQQKGRWPANGVLSHNNGCKLVGKRTVKSGIGGPLSRGRGAGVPGDGADGADPVKGVFRSAAGVDEHGNEEIDAYECEETCPVRLLDLQSGDRPGMPRTTKRKGVKNGAMFNPGDDDASLSPGFGDSGGASRFFYVAKASKKDRNFGLPDGVLNKHPTVKSCVDENSLMRWLIRLITPPGGTVLDTFGGSGSTGVAALLEGFNVVLIEREEEYFNVARARCAAVGVAVADVVDVMKVSAPAASPEEHYLEDF